MNPTIQKIRKSLKENIDDKTQKSFQRFFKEEVKCYGVKTAMVRKISNKFWKEIKTLEFYYFFRDFRKGLCWQSLK